MNNIRKKTGGFIKAGLLVIGLLASGLAASAWWLNGSFDRHVSVPHDLTYEIARADFVSSITEPGTVTSSSNFEIRCRVRERGGTPILELVDEGTEVKTGDFLAQLDDSSFRDELVEQKILVATDRASVIQAESDLNTARRSLLEFENGQFAQELATLEAELAFAQETQRRATQYEKYSENLARKGYVTKAQLEADRFAVIKSEKEVSLAKSKLAVLRDYSKDRMKAELEAEIQKQEAQLEASQHTMELSQQRLAFYEQQVAGCRIVAPVDGQVVYANDIEGRGDSGIVIEEGVNVLEGQAIFRLPDPTKMQMIANVSDSRINNVCPGQSVIIRLNTAPDSVIDGIVRKVADFPMPQRWSQAPIEYEVFIEITTKNSVVRSGLRGTAEICVDKVDKAILAPVSSIVRQGGAHFVVVADGNERELRQVSLGPNNESHVVIAGGLRTGESVLVVGDTYKDSGEKTTTPEN